MKKILAAIWAFLSWLGRVFSEWAKNKRDEELANDDSEKIKDAGNNIKDAPVDPSKRDPNDVFDNNDNNSWSKK